jgi:hypothetical protein
MKDLPIYDRLTVVPVKELEFRAAKYDVVLREASPWATHAMHTILSRMVVFRCHCCNERFATFHPAYRPPDALRLEILKKGGFGAPVCSVEVHSWNEAPPFEESEGDLLVARTYESSCLVCYLDVKKEMRRLGVDSQELVIALRSMQNRMDPCWNFPHRELGELFAHATVIEASLVALEHMQLGCTKLGCTNSGRT